MTDNMVDNTADNTAHDTAGDMPKDVSGNMPVITVRQMYEIENRGHEMGFLKKFMMENAGAASARRLAERFDDMRSKRIAVLAGMGNNGGDGLVIARHLAGYGADVTVRLLGMPGSIKTEESAWNWSILERMESVTLAHGDMPVPDTISAPPPDIIVDAILGTGISGEIREPFASAITAINNADCFKLAVDVPSGLDPQTGEAANLAVKSDMTITFHRMKQGIPRRPDLTGTIYTERIGIPPEAEKGIL